MTKRVCFWVIAFVVVIFASSCRHSTDGDDNKPVPAPAPVVKKLDKIVVAGDGVTEIAVEKGTDITTNPISTKGIKINALYNTGEILVTRENDFTTDGWSVDFSQINTADETDKTNNRGYTQPIVFTYTYEGVTATAEVLVRIVDSNNFESIEVVDSSRVKDHDIGETFDPFGLVVRVVLDSAANDYVDVIDFSDDTKWTFESAPGTGTVDTSAANDALQVTVTYKTSSKSDSKDFTIVVYDGDDVNSIEITQFPNKTEYDYGSTDLDLTGLNVKLILKKDNREVLVNDWSGVNQSGSKWTYTGFDGNQDATPQEITLTYTTRGGKTYEVKFTVTVIGNKFKGLTLVSGPTDVQYIIGEKFNPSGLKVTVNHLNSTYDFDFEPTNVSEFTGRWELAGWNAGNEAESLPLTVRYKNDDGSVIYGEVTFNVSIYTITNISITEPTGNDVIYFDGEPIQYVKDIYLATAGLNIDMQAGSKSKTENYPITSTMFTVNMSVTGDVNAAGDEFEYKTGNATVTCSVSWGPTLTRDPSFGLTIVKPYQFHETIEKFTGALNATGVDGDEIDYNSGTITTLSGINDTLQFVTFGDYPQTIAKIGTATEGSLYIFESEKRKKVVGGLVMYPDINGDYYVKVESAKKGDASGDNSQYEFSDGTLYTSWENKECWFKVEPIVWRVLDTNYKNAGALLWSVKSIDRIPYFADDITPDGGNGSGLVGGGKSSRTINGVSVDWKNYQYSTVRAFLRGEYESGDSQRTDVQYFTGTTPAKKFQDLDDTKRGFLQSAFTDVAQSKLVAAEIETGLYDKIFILSEDELLTPDADYYFKSRAYYSHSGIDLIGNTKQGNGQVQRRKQLTDYTMAKEAKRWSKSRKVGSESVTVSYPGGEIWTRTATGSGVQAITGWGSVLGTDTGTARGAHKAKSVVPAICVDPSALP